MLNEPLLAIFGSLLSILTGICYYKVTYSQDCTDIIFDLTGLDSLSKIG
jgi:hypothetical protein